MVLLDYSGVILMAMIRVKEEVRRALKKKKLYKRESYNDVLNRLMKEKKRRSPKDAIKKIKVVKDSKLIRAGGMA